MRLKGGHDEMQDELEVIQLQMVFSGGGGDVSLKTLDYILRRRPLFGDVKGVASDDPADYSEAEDDVLATGMKERDLTRQEREVTPLDVE